MSDRLPALEPQLHALWQRAAQGDARSYEQLLTLLSRHLRRFLARRMAGQASDVEDLVQETLMAIHLKRHTYQSGQPLSAWVLAIARYKWVDHLRAHGRRGRLHEDIDDWAEVLATEDDAAADTQRDLQHVLGELPPRQREAIAHTRLQGLSVAETARLTGQSESAVKVNVHRGLKALVARWGKHA